MTGPDEPFGDDVDVPCDGLRDATPTEQDELDQLSTEYREVD